MNDGGGGADSFVAGFNSVKLSVQSFLLYHLNLAFLAVAI